MTFSPPRLPLPAPRPLLLIKLRHHGDVLLATPAAHTPRRRRPVGKIDMRHIQIDCNKAVDSGLYTFTFGKTGQQVKARYTYTYRWDGKQWKISSHHSSALPEKPGAAAH